MELFHITVRSLAAYAILLVLLRLAGKRTLAQGTPFDFVLALVLGDMVDDLLWAEVSLAKFAVAVSTLALMQTMTALLQSRSVSFHAWVEGTPQVVLRTGRLEVAALRSERIREEDLEAHLRLVGVDRTKWGGVKTAWIETNGQLSALKTDAARELERRDLQGHKR
jgi:uncharacterized membrane protein YcaP (DUF421 family)